MLSVNEQLTGTRDKLIPSYWVEGGGFSKLLPFNCGLRKARKLAQEWANKWGETVHLTVRVGYGKPKYVDGQALYYPQEQKCDVCGLTVDLTDEQMCSAWPDCGHTDAECREAAKSWAVCDVCGHPNPAELVSGDYFCDSCGTTCDPMTRLEWLQNKNERLAEVAE